MRISDKIKYAGASIQHGLLAIRNDLRGMSGIEFAMIAPMLIGIYLGVAETALGVTNSRKVSRVAGTLADLVAQTENITGSEVDGIMNASVSVMAPYSSDGLVIKVVGVQIDEFGDATVAWSRSKNGSAPSVGSGYFIPTDIKIPDTFLIVTNVSYDYSPNLGSNLISSFNFNETNYNVPRTSATVQFAN